MDLQKRSILTKQKKTIINCSGSLGWLLEYSNDFKSYTYKTTQGNVDKYLLHMCKYATHRRLCNNLDCYHTRVHKMIDIGR